MDDENNFLKNFDFNSFEKNWMENKQSSRKSYVLL
jgi:hypothetical protein